MQGEAHAVSRLTLDRAELSAEPYVLKGMPNEALHVPAHQLSFGSPAEWSIARHRGYDLVAHWKARRVSTRRGAARAPTDQPAGRRAGRGHQPAPRREGAPCASTARPTALPSGTRAAPKTPNSKANPAPALGEVHTVHRFDPCALLATARSELKPERRRRQRGGGFEPAGLEERSTHRPPDPTFRGDGSSAGAYPSHTLTSPCLPELCSRAPTRRGSFACAFGLPSTGRAVTTACRSHLARTGELTAYHP